MKIYLFYCRHLGDNCFVRAEALDHSRALELLSEAVYELLVEIPSDDACFGPLMAQFDYVVVDHA